MEKSLYSERYKILLDLLVELREKSGLRQAALARAIDKSQSTVSKMEAGERRIDIAELAGLASALGTDIETVMVEMISRWKRAGLM